MGRKIIAIVLTIIVIIIVGYLNSIGLISIVDFSTSLIVGLVLLLPYLYIWVLNPYLAKTKPQEAPLAKVTEKKQDISQSSSSLKKEQDTDKIANSIFLPDVNQMEKISLDNNKINEIYCQALTLAKSVYHDNQLSNFTLQVYPYQTKTNHPEKVNGNVNLYFDFYSKTSNKITRTRYDELNGISHTIPDKDAHDNLDKMVYSKELPWDSSPNWALFLTMAYEIVKPLSNHKNTVYHLSAKAFLSNPWKWVINFEDGYNGKEPKIYWDGKGFETKSFKKFRC